MRHFDVDFPTLGGSSFDKEEVRELEALNIDSLRSIDALIRGEGESVRADLLRQGQRWAQHVLEGPISWIISAVYIFVTVRQHPNLAPNGNPTLTPKWDSTGNRRLDSIIIPVLTPDGTPGRARFHAALRNRIRADDFVTR